MSLTIRDLILEAKTKNDSLSEERLQNVYDFAEVMHAGQLRHSGDSYITHPLAVASIVVSWGLDQTSVEAALLHDLPEMSGVSFEKIASLFGEDTANLVAGVSRVGNVKLRGSRSNDFVENLRRMFVSMAKDLRVVLIRLADRLHNMQTLDAIPLSKQKGIALETLEIYAPLAERLGMGKLKGDLEDLSFPYVFPNEHQWIMDVAKPHFKYSAQNTERIIRKIRTVLAQNNIKARVEGRPKRKYSLYKKLLRPYINRDISKVHDLVAIRVITKDTPSAYQSLGLIHEIFRPVPSLGISDFIAIPKPNGYRSIHTKVFDDKGNITEIQIRSEEMHIQAEFGAAAHFVYSETKNAKTEEMGEADLSVSFSKKMTWVKELANWKEQVSFTSGSVKDFQLDVLSSRIYVFSPKGDVYDLPAKSTPIDFAFAVHSDLGLYLQSASVNEKIVPLTKELKSGDVVSIQKSKNQKIPAKNWLRLVKTQKAKTTIRKALQSVDQMSVK